MKNMILITAVLVIFSAGAAIADGYTLIVNKSNPSGSLTAREVKDIFLGRDSSWDNGNKITLFTQSAASFHPVFIKEVVGKNSQQFSLFWKKALFTGQGIPPADVSDDAAMKEKVSRNPGAVGYISSAAVDDTVKRIDIY